MKKLIAVVGGVVLAGAAVAALGMGASSADPVAGGTLNVVGEPYAKAVAILRAQGVAASFGGSVGSDVAQSQCLVSSQKIVNSGKIQLMLDCTEEAQPEAPAATSVANTPGAPAADGSRPTPGAQGVVTVTPTRVG